LEQYELNTFLKENKSFDSEGDMITPMDILKRVIGDANSNIQTKTEITIPVIKLKSAIRAFKTAVHFMEQTEDLYNIDQIKFVKSLLEKAEEIDQVEDNKKRVKIEINEQRKLLGDDMRNVGDYTYECERISVEDEESEEEEDENMG